MRPKYVTRRVQTILKGFAKRGFYTLPDGSIVESHSAHGNGPGQPLTHILCTRCGSQIWVCDGQSVRYTLDPVTDRYVQGCF